MNIVLLVQTVLFLLLLTTKILDASEPDLFESKRQGSTEKHHRIDNSNNGNTIATIP